MFVISKSQTMSFSCSKHFEDKKTTFTLCFTLLIVLLPISNNAQEQKLDSVQTFIWDDPISPNDWLMQFREHYAYDNGGVDFTNRTSLNKDNNTSTWINNNQIIKMYNVQDKLESDIFKFWNGTDWVNSSKVDYTYDGSGNNNVITYYNHNGSDWFLTGQDLQVYNGSNLVTETTHQMWNGMSFENIAQMRAAYSSDLLMEESYYNWNLGAMPQDWDTSSHRRNTYNYIGILIKDYLTEVDQGSGLENSSFVENTYNANNNLETATVQAWNKDNGEFENSTQAVYSFDMNNQILELITYTWLDVSFWAPQFKAIPFWSDATFSTNPNEIYIDKAYPNPFNSNLNIKLQSALKYNGELKIIDITGKEISKTEIKKVQNLLVLIILI